MALAESLAELVADEARRAGAGRVTLVRIALGALGHVEPESLRFCFDAVTRGTSAEGASFDIVVLPGTGFCLDCQQSVALAARYDACPACGGVNVQMTGGDELRLTEMEVE